MHTGSQMATDASRGSPQPWRLRKERGCSSPCPMVRVQGRRQVYLLLRQRFSWGTSVGLQVRLRRLTRRLGTNDKSCHWSHPRPHPSPAEERPLSYPEWSLYWPLEHPQPLLPWCHPSTGSNSLLLALEVLYSALGDICQSSMGVPSVVRPQGCNPIHTCMRINPIDYKLMYICIDMHRIGL